MPCCANNSADSTIVLLHVQRSGDSGSPRVIGSTSLSSAGHTSGCRTSNGRLPALRRTLTTSSGRARARPKSARALIHGRLQQAPLLAHRLLRVHGGGRSCRPDPVDPLGSISTPTRSTRPFGSPYPWGLFLGAMRYDEF